MAAGARVALQLYLSLACYFAYRLCTERTVILACDREANSSGCGAGGCVSSIYLFIYFSLEMCVRVCVCVWDPHC